MCGTVNMWRYGVVLFLGCTLIENVSASPVSRDKRALYCPSEYPPPPPPPPFWPPPPPYWPPPPPPPPPPPYWEHRHHHHDSAAISQAEALTNQESANQGYQSANQQESANQGYQSANQPPCDTCKRQSSAISNANSDTGDAVAIAIARAKTSKK